MEVTTGGSNRYIFNAKASDAMGAGSVGFNLVQRKWTLVSLGASIEGIFNTYVSFNIQNNVINDSQLKLSTTKNVFFHFHCQFYF